MQIFSRAWAAALVSTFLAAFVATPARAETATITGRVVDSSGKPLEKAVVIVYSAGVKKGYSVFCPTCYKDCGKRTTTVADGTYTLSGLAPSLHFTLLAAKDGYLAAFIPDVDPDAGPAMDARLASRPVVDDPMRVVRGRIVNARGEPQRGAVIQPKLASYRMPNGDLGFSQTTRWINEITVTNVNGEFELSYDKPSVELTFLVTARAMAPRYITAPTGAERQTFVVTEGATIRGRLVRNGEPVAGAEMRLIANNSALGRWYPDERIGTTDDGSFAFTNVPPGRIWLLAATMESAASRNLATDIVTCQTERDSEILDLGDLRLRDGYTLSGKVVLRDGKPVPAGMHLLVVRDRMHDSELLEIAADGSFRAAGLTEGIYTVGPSVRSYRLANDCLDMICPSLEILVHGDVKDFLIPMDPEVREAAPK
jgi:hypothetical protein